MPSIQINCNLPASAIPSKFAEEINELVHELLGKPKQFIMTWIAPEQQICFGLESGPSALCDLCCVGNMGVEENKTYSDAICTKLHKDLGIPPERVFITFTDMKGANVGWNKKTFSHLDKKT